MGIIFDPISIELKFEDCFFNWSRSHIVASFSAELFKTFGRFLFLSPCAPTEAHNSGSHGLTKLFMQVIELDAIE